MILNGAPRSGKSSISAAIQETFPGVWINIGVDIARAMTPPALQPGVGLRPGAPDQKLLPYKGLKFKIPEFADVIVEFVEENGQITAIKQIDPSGEYVSKRK